MPMAGFIQLMLRARVEDAIEHPDLSAVLILARRYLRTLVEEHVRLLLAVFLVDYLKKTHMRPRQRTRQKQFPTV